MTINRTLSIKAYMATPLLSWNAVTASDVKQSSRNWRWSESPEMEVSAVKDELESNKKENDNMKHNSDTEFRNNETMKERRRHTDNNKKPKQKKTKHERNKDHKKHKRKRANSSDGVDVERHDIRKANKSKQRSKNSRSSSTCSSFSDDSSKHRRSTAKDHDRGVCTGESNKRRHSKSEDKSGSKTEKSRANQQSTKSNNS